MIYKCMILLGVLFVEKGTMLQLPGLENSPAKQFNSNELDFFFPPEETKTSQSPFEENSLSLGQEPISQTYEQQTINKDETSTSKSSLLQMFQYAFDNVDVDTLKMLKNIINNDIAGQEILQSTQGQHAFPETDFPNNENSQLTGHGHKPMSLPYNSNTNTDTAQNVASEHNGNLISGHIWNHPPNQNPMMNGNQQSNTNPTKDLGHYENEASGTNSNGNMFDPNKLLLTLSAITSASYDPNAFNSNQKYIGTQQWNPSAQYIPGQTQKKPGESIGAAQTGNTANNQKYNTGVQMNFEPNAMMGSPATHEQFSFNPDKINTESGSFNPGQMVIGPTGSNTEVTSIFNADNINKLLMKYGNYGKNIPQQQNQQFQLQQPERASTPLKSSTGSSSPSQFFLIPFQFFHNSMNNAPGEEKGSTQSLTNENYQKITSLGTESTTKSFKNEVSDKNTETNNVMLSVAPFNPDEVNTGQRVFNPDAMMHNLLLVLNKHHIQKRGVSEDLHPNESTTKIPSTTPDRLKFTEGNGKSWTTTKSTSIFQGSKETTTKSTTPSTTPFLMYNPDKVNSPIMQSQGFQSELFNVNYGGNGFNSFGNNFKPGGVSYLTSASGIENNNGDKMTSGLNFGQSNTFDPSKFNDAKMTFDIDSHMGFFANSVGNMYDPVKTNLESMKPNTNNSDPYSYGSQFLAANGMNLIDNSAYVGKFDPSAINQQAFANTAAEENGTDSMFMFMGMNGLTGDMNSLGMGNINGGKLETAFIGNFDPSAINSAVFDPNVVNNVHMNFDPTDMLKTNPGYDASLLGSFKFDPNKVNNVQINLIPTSLNEDKNHTTNSGNTMNSNMNAGYVFNPTDLNNALMSSNPLQAMLATLQGISGGQKKNNSLNFGNFDPSAVNQAQMMFIPPGAIINSGSNGVQQGTNFNPTKVNNIQGAFTPDSKNQTLSRITTTTERTTTLITTTVPMTTTTVVNSTVDRNMTTLSP